MFGNTTSSGRASALPTAHDISGVQSMLSRHLPHVPVLSQILSTFFPHAGQRRFSMNGLNMVFSLMRCLEPILPGFTVAYREGDALPALFGFKRGRHCLTDSYDGPLNGLPGKAEQECVVHECFNRAELIHAKA